MKAFIGTLLILLSITLVVWAEGETLEVQGGNHILIFGEDINKCPNVSFTKVEENWGKTIASFILDLEAIDDVQTVFKMYGVEIERCE